LPTPADRRNRRKHPEPDSSSCREFSKLSLALSEGLIIIQRSLIGLRRAGRCRQWRQTYGGNNQFQGKLRASNLAIERITAMFVSSERIVLPIEADPRRRAGKGTADDAGTSFAGRAHE
jgi:hypothetical protein